MTSEGEFQPVTQEKVKFSPKVLCDQCGTPNDQIAEVCPFMEEIYGEIIPCNCCDDCRAECANDV